MFERILEFLFIVRRTPEEKLTRILKELDTVQDKLFVISFSDDKKHCLLLASRMNIAKAGNALKRIVHNKV